MINLNNLSPKEIFSKYNFPHKFYIRFLLDIAKYQISLEKKPKVEDLKAIEVTELWLKGLATEAECRKAADATAAYAASASANAAAYAASAAAANAADAAYAAAYAAHAVYASYADKYKEILINNINNLSELEKIIIGISK